MKERIIMLCLTLSTFIWSQDHVSVNINLEKTSYLLSEPIFFEITCINSSTKPIPTHYITDYLFIQDKSGKVYHSNIETLGPIHTIAPGDTFFYTPGILSLYGNISVKDENDFYGLPKGTYTIYVKYSGEKFSVQSNKFVINIIDPTGEEKEAFKLYTKMWIMFSNSSKFDYKEIIKAGNKLVDSYPNSVYAPSALALSAVLGPGMNLEIQKRLLYEYPDSRVSQDALGYLINNYKIVYKSREWAIEFLKKIKRTLPKTLIAKEADKQLQKLQNK